MLLHFDSEMDVYVEGFVDPLILNPLDWNLIACFLGNCTIADVYENEVVQRRYTFLLNSSKTCLLITRYGFVKLDFPTFAKVLREDS